MATYDIAAALFTQEVSDLREDAGSTAILVVGSGRVLVQFVKNGRVIADAPSKCRKATAALGRTDRFHASNPGPMRPRRPDDALLIARASDCVVIDVVTLSSMRIGADGVLQLGVIELASTLPSSAVVDEVNETGATRFRSLVFSVISVQSWTVHDADVAFAASGCCTGP